MITAKEAIRTARSCLGTAYREMDCMALIRSVIRRSEGGIMDYRCEGTNWLWRSIGNCGKYRHLIWRQEGLEAAAAGMLVFKRRGEDVHHVGLVTDEGTVIHASSEAGCVVETKLDDSWDCLAQHKCIAHERAAQEDCADEVMQNVRITIIDSAGRHFVPAGDWRVLIGSID